MELSTSAAFQRLKKILEEKNVRCPVCGCENFTAVPGYINHPLQENVDRYALKQGPMIPTVAVACADCGFLFQHVVGVLNPDAYKKTEA